MSLLSDEQLAILEMRIAADISDAGLMEDLLDHYCCFVEEQMDEGLDFDSAYGKAFQAISPNGIHEIQEELYFLLTYKKQTNMKRAVYGLGFTAAFLISTGIMFRVMHWPGARVILISGFASLLCTMFIMVYNSLKALKNMNATTNLRIFAGLAAGILIASGNLFKLSSFPTANMQVVLGMGLLNFVFLPMLFYQLYRKSLAA